MFATPKSTRSTSPPILQVFCEKREQGPDSRKMSAHNESMAAQRIRQFHRANMKAVDAANARRASAPQSERAPSTRPQNIPHRTRAVARRSRNEHGAHDPNALPPAVAALLACTGIPPPRPRQLRRKPANPRRISVDDLVDSWKQDELSGASYGTSPALNILLGERDDDGQSVEGRDDDSEGSFLHSRSTSADSVPSLETDDTSILSSGTSLNAGSLHSKYSSPSLRRERMRSLPLSEECLFDHPLMPIISREEEPDDLYPPITFKVRTKTPKSRTTFRSNLTTSLQAFTKAAVSSISSITNTATPPSAPSPVSNDMLWSHPYLFPRLSSEVRPPIEGTATEAQRKYFNPLPPPTFEELEAPYQEALHAPYLAERDHDLLGIQMQTYNRGRRKSQSKSGGGGAGSQSEAGRALLSDTGVRLREPRENGDFLRIVVLEMNMRRKGKLEHGKAKIWLQPRMVTPVSRTPPGQVPRRWVGESAYTE